MAPATAKPCTISSPTRRYSIGHANTNYSLSTVSDRAFPVAAARLWNSLPSHITAAPLSVFCCRLKSHLFSLSYPTAF